jgi:hypothetical protein
MSADARARWSSARRDRSPVGTAARGHVPALALVFLAVGGVASAGTLSTDIGAVAVSMAGETTPGVGLRPRLQLRLALEVGALAGFGAAGVATLGFTASDDRVDLRRGAPVAALGALAGVVAAAVGWVVLTPALVDAFASGATSAGVAPSTDAAWLAEVGLFVPVALALGAALPSFVVAAARSGLVSARLGGRQRGYAVLAVAVFASLFSPPDPATFALVAAPPLGGFGLGVAWLELV